MSDFTDVSSISRGAYVNFEHLFTNTTTDQITLAITLDIAEFKQLVLKDQPLAKTLIANIHDNGNGSFGVNNNYSSYDHDSDGSTANVVKVSGLYGASGGNVGASSYGITQGLESATLWDTANAASIILTLDRTVTGATAIFTVGHNNGSYTQLGGTWWEGVNSDKQPQVFNELYLHSSVESAYLANGTVTVENAKALGKSVAPAVPEPTTATLSLLALAGLAARRRCK